ncbi:MAG: pyruvate ferredoxin oxidoreductase [Actinomycetes bacterium]|jgi:pyruvate ferredoxin oxidoreductase beta subunit|nr:pyruvate ferredoxin oxidoreductase [Actinomycetes bacterium]
MATIKEHATVPERFVGGHRLCAGCGASIVVRQVMLGAGKDVEVVAGCATGCLEVSTTIYPYSSWDVPFIHNAFENAAATISGVEAAYKGLRRAGKIDPDRRVKFVAFGGDGGTYDIGLQALSGAAERGHDLVYVCYDNGAYMNTGIQRSSATPHGAWATTSEVGSVQPGKPQRRKDLTSIMAAHHIPYVAQASVGYWQDLVRKAEKAFTAEGPAFLNVLAPCPRGWRHAGADTTTVGRLAVETGFWPLFEVENGVWRLTMPARARTLKPVEEFLKLQGRFRHLFKEGNEELLADIQREVDEYYAYVQGRCNCS